MVIARLEDRVFETLRLRGEPSEIAAAMASHVRSAATILSKYGPRDGPRAHEYLEAWLKVLESPGMTPADAWNGLSPAPPPAAGAATG